MTPLEQAKIRYSDACVNLEIAQNQHVEAKRNLVQLLNKEQSCPTETGKADLPNSKSE